MVGTNDRRWSLAVGRWPLAVGCWSLTADRRAMQKSEKRVVTILATDQRPMANDRLFLVQQTHGLQYHEPHDLDALGAELVQRILRRVVEDIAVAIVEID